MTRADPPRLRALVLGSGGGGGVPQWNCNCRVCRVAWDGDSRVKPRTQSSLAVSVDGERWLLLNASIDLRQQILATPAMQPKGQGRQSPIAAGLLTNTTSITRPDCSPCASASHSRSGARARRSTPSARTGFSTSSAATSFRAVASLSASRSSRCRA